MRKIIAFEGTIKIPGLLLELGSLKWSEEPIPVTSSWTAKRDWEIIGKARDLRLEDDGSITAEFTPLVDSYNETIERNSFTVFANEVFSNTENNVRVVQSATIREIFIPEPNGVPW